MTKEQEQQTHEAIRLLEEAGIIEWKIDSRDSTALRADVVFIKKAEAGTEWVWEPNSSEEQHD